MRKMKLPQPRRYNDKMEWESLIENGENPQGFTAQTANGTAKWHGTGWNQRAYDYTMEQMEPSPVAPGGRSNRTGE